MANSIEFNSVDLSSYGLTVTAASINRQRQRTGSLQLKDRAVAMPSGKRPKVIPLRFTVTAATRLLLDGYLDSVRLACVTEDEAELRRDTLPGRYWNAVLAEMDGDYISNTVFQGWMTFECADSRAYDDTENTPEDNANTDSYTMTEAVGGTDYARPLYTLTAGELLTDVTIQLESLETGELLQWIGTLANTKELKIDSVNFTVLNEDVADMSDVSGQWPRLMPNQDNRIKVTGFGTLGKLKITYRDTYL